MAKQLTKLFKTVWDDNAPTHQKAGMRFFTTEKAANSWPVAGAAVLPVEVGQKKEELVAFLNDQLALNG